MTNTTMYPCLWFDGVAEQAAEHYVGIFPGSQVEKVWDERALTFTVR